MVTYYNEEIDEFFRQNSDTYKYPKCIGCEQKKKDIVKKENRFLRKADNAIRSHCDKYNKRMGTNLTPKQFRVEFNWNRRRMAHESEHIYNNGCPNCGESFVDMGHGLRDIEIDIKHPEAPPIYGFNTQWICHTCNHSKSQLPPYRYAIRQRCWHKWKKGQEKLEQDQGFGTLFEGIGVDFSAKKEQLIKAHNREVT
jgi:hypothetical protein